jgi:hypothetical protein
LHSLLLKRSWGSQRFPAQGWQEWAGEGLRGAEKKKISVSKGLLKKFLLYERRHSRMIKGSNSQSCPG